MRKVVLAGLAILACLGAPALAATSVPSTGSFLGHTSQRGRFYHVAFRVRGRQIKRMRMGWRASCRSGRTLRMATRQGRTRIIIRHGAWSSTGRYSGPIPPDYTGRFRLLENRGRFLSPNRAQGSFRIAVRVYRQGRLVDRCGTGLVHWTARRRR